MHTAPRHQGSDRRSKPHEPRRSGPRRRSIFRSRIRNAGRSDIDASRRTRLAGPDPVRRARVPSIVRPPFPEKLDLRSHCPTPRRPGTRVASCGTCNRCRFIISGPLKEMMNGHDCSCTEDQHLSRRTTWSDPKALGGYAFVAGKPKTGPDPAKPLWCPKPWCQFFLPKKELTPIINHGQRPWYWGRPPEGAYVRTPRWGRGVGAVQVSPRHRQRLLR